MLEAENKEVIRSFQITFSNYGQMAAVGAPGVLNAVLNAHLDQDGGQNAPILPGSVAPPGYLDVAMKRQKLMNESPNSTATERETGATYTASLAIQNAGIRALCFFVISC
jgi:hypothetical protein